MLNPSKCCAIANVSAMIVVSRPGAPTAMHYALDVLSVQSQHDRSSSGEEAQNQNGRIRHAWETYLAIACWNRSPAHS